MLLCCFAPPAFRGGFHPPDLKFTSGFPIQTGTRLRISTAFQFRKANVIACALPLSSDRSIPENYKSITGLRVQYSDGMPVLHMNGLSHRRIPKWWLLAAVIIIISIIRRIVVLRHLSRIYRRESLLDDIAQFYDVRSAAWERVWGEHLHHGLYDVVDGHRLSGVQAQVRTMQQLLQFGGLDSASLPSGSRILDIGCGVGGASRYLARKFGPDCKVTGITLSPYQVSRAAQLTQEAGLANQVLVEVKNALSTDFPDEHFDFVWSLESAEHMEDKHKFIEEATRVLKPGSTLVMLAWCLRETSPPLTVSERFAVRKVMEEYCLPRVAPPSEYMTEMLRAGLRHTHFDDWTMRAAPFWDEVVQSAAFSRDGWTVLRETGWPLIRSALAMRHMIAAIKMGVLRIVAFTARKPTADELEEEARTKIEC